MDWVTISAKATEYIKKYRFVLLVLLAGLALMCIPGGKRGEKKAESIDTVTSNQTEIDPGKDLEEILSHIQGAGKVKVLLTQLSGEKIVYQTDEDSGANGDSSTVHRETVIVSDAQRAQHGLVQQVTPPVYLGAVIVCQGADRATVRLAIVEAVSNATGLSADRISVLKMK